LTFLETLRRAVAHLRQPRASHATSPAHDVDGGDDLHGGGAYASGLESDFGENTLSSMDPAALTAWENRDVPSIKRTSDAAEARADERQDPTTSANFPLHWTSATQSWNYLFDFSVACEMLAPRPDDLVLDFAAGTCWATELLSRLGVRTVSVDLSLEMMRRGRERLAADRRLVWRDQAAFVAARGQSLPFRDECFEGVLCMNALHHVPSYSAVLHELYRVLKPGGRAVFAEPGTAHAVQPLSQFRMCEEGVLEKRVSLPAVRRLAMQAGFSRMRVVPLRSTAAYVFDYSASPADNAPLRQMWDETLRAGPTEHARFVLQKGDDPAADTLLPALRLVGQLAARIDPGQMHAVSKEGHPFEDMLSITNTGRVTWKARGRRFGGQVTLGVKIYDARGALLTEDLGRTALPRDVAPGEEIRLRVVLPGVLPAADYELKYDMVVEGVIWFELEGSPCARCSLRVIP
jgi:SAM-dependent methyltransferase